MEQQSIRKTIDNNNKKIEELLTPGVFTLNTAISALIEENASLRMECKHEFKDGSCIWCDIPEEFK